MGDDHNEANPENPVEVGDHVIAVNGVRGGMAMLRESQTKGVLELLVTAIPPP